MEREKQKGTEPITMNSRRRKKIKSNTKDLESTKSNCKNKSKYISISSSAILKYHRLGGLNSGNLFLILVEAGSLMLGRRRGQVLVRTPFLAYKQPPFCCVFTWPLFGMAQGGGEISPATYEATDPIRIGSHPFDLIQPSLPP